MEVAEGHRRADPVLKGSDPRLQEPIVHRGSGRRDRDQSRERKGKSPRCVALTHDPLPFSLWPIVCRAPTKNQGLELARPSIAARQPIISSTRVP